MATLRWASLWVLLPNSIRSLPVSVPHCSDLCHGSSIFIILCRGDASSETTPLAAQVTACTS